MKVNVNANVTIKNHEGVLSHGAVDWVDDTTLQFQSDGYLPRGAACELRLDLPGAGETVYAEGDVLSIDSTSTPPSAIVRLRMANHEREKLDSWVEERSQVSQLSQLTNPQSRSAASGTQRRSGRRNIQKALKRTVTERRQTQPARPQPQPAPTPAPRAARPPVATHADPQFVIDQVDRVTVTWATRETLAEAIDQLRKGHLALPCTPGVAKFLLRLILPDGQIFAIPATAQPADSGCVAHFRIGLPLKQKLRRAARGE